MEPGISLVQLRELFLSAEASRAARVVAIVGSFTVAAVVLHLVRRRALREEFTPIWLGVALGLLVLSLNLDLLRVLTRLIGAWTPSSTIFFFGELFLLATCLHFAVRLSQASVQIKNLGQELALLRARLDERDPPGQAPPHRAGD
ncbi:MAG TPA: DUF2304 domain-containing protein [Myxococcota bacterium]|nr:DUF2304 domain-containing protein [Myxococcota bacterium]